MPDQTTQANQTRHDAPAIEVAGLSFSYPDGTCALEGISFSLQPGQRLAVLGPNGAGKSTLLLILAGLLFGDGTVRINDTELTKSSARSIRGTVGIVFQDPDDQLFMPTVIEDAMFGPLNQGLDDEAARGAAMQALEAMGVAHLADRPPHHLSVGQKQRVAIAGVLAMKPSILCLDEPGSGLDPRGRGTLIKLLSRLPVTLVVATHNLTLAQRLCDTALVLHAGRQLAFGPLEQILSDTNLLRRAELTED